MLVRLSADNTCTDSVRLAPPFRAVATRAGREGIQRNPGDVGKWESVPREVRCPGQRDRHRGQTL